MSQKNDVNLVIKNVNVFNAIEEKSQKQFLAIFCGTLQVCFKFQSEAILQINVQPVDFHTFSPFIIFFHRHKYLIAITRN